VVRGVRFIVDVHLVRRPQPENFSFVFYPDIQPMRDCGRLETGPFSLFWRALSGLASPFGPPLTGFALWLLLIYLLVASAWTQLLRFSSIFPLSLRVYGFSVF